MNIIPEQKIGKQYDHVTSVVCKSSGEAERKYAMACNRLTAINNWGKIGSSVLHTDFFLCDTEGKQINREPAINDFIKINLMGPGSKSGDGFDWVQIEQMVEKENEDYTAFKSIKVRPAVCPTNESKGIAHFFDKAATTTFIISKKDKEIFAQIHGRNEEANKTTTHTADNLRNAVVASFAELKFSDIQWKSLCEGFLS